MNNKQHNWCCGTPMYRAFLFGQVGDDSSSNRLRVSRIFVTRVYGYRPINIQPIPSFSSGVIETYRPRCVWHLQVDAWKGAGGLQQTTCRARYRLQRCLGSKSASRRTGVQLPTEATSFKIERHRIPAGKKKLAPVHYTRHGNGNVEWHFNFNAPELVCGVDRVFLSLQSATLIM